LARWGKVGEEDEAWYFEAVEESVRGHGWQIGQPGMRDNDDLGGNSNGGRV